MNNLTLIMTVVMGGNLLLANPVTTTEMSVEQALTHSKNSNKNIFLNMNAEWCLPCLMLKEGTLADEKVKETLASHYISIDVDIDDATRNDWTEGYTVSCLPNLMIINDEGGVLAELSGSISADELVSMLNMYTADSSKEATNIAAPKEATKTDAPLFTLIDDTPVLEKVVNDIPTEKPLQESHPAPATRVMNNVKMVSTKKKYTVTVGAFSVYENVVNFQEKLSETITEEFFLTRNSKEHYVLNVGKFHSSSNADSLKKKLAQNKIDHYVRKI